MRRALVIGGVAVFAIGGMVWVLSGQDRKAEMAKQSPTDFAQGFVMPPLNRLESQGARLFANNCARCHGPNGLGSNSGPPLVHDIYNPGHHPDEAFYRAVQFGVRQHHWRFGDMPSLREQVRVHEVRAIIAYLRQLQRANGIVSRPHRMPQ